MKSKIKRKVLFILLAVMVTVIVMFIASIVWNMGLILSENIKIVDQAPFPEWNQKDLDYVQKLTGVKLPLGTILLAYSNCDGRGRHDVNWWIFSEKKILFPCELNNDDVPYSNQKHLFEEGCQKIGEHSDFSIKEDIQSCLSSYKLYDGKGHDVFIEIKTSKGYYVSIEYCRILPRNSPAPKNNTPDQTK